MNPIAWSRRHRIVMQLSRVMGPTSSIRCALLLAGTLLVESGCEPTNDHVACYPTTGQVLIGDQPADGVMIKFYNAKNPKNVDAPQPYATTDASGIYSLSTFEADDGAPADDYIVIILWPEGPPGPGSPKDRLGN